ncbi:MAG: shikimate kinase [Bacteroidales bacterium]
MQSRIFLIGFMGSGKSTLGSRLARKIGYTHVDMDHLIEETAEMSIPGIFSEHGETVFRKWEQDILGELCQRERIVVSTGGGAPCHNNLIEVMNLHGATVYIQLDPVILQERLLRSRTERPLIKGKSPSQLLEYIREKLKEREPFYLKAQYVVNGATLKPEELVAMVSGRESG